MKANLLTPITKRMPLVLLLAASFMITLNSCTVTSGATYQQSYGPPAWAPSYDDANVQYYYFPDYDMYYDVWGNQFWYDYNGTWFPSATLPSAYANVDLNSSYVVLINKSDRNPWTRHDYYARNYPAHGYDNYQDIEVSNRVVRNNNPDHPLRPRVNNTSDNTHQWNQQDNSGRTRDDHQPTQTPAVPTQPVQSTQDNTHQWNQQDNSGRNRGGDHQPTQTPAVPTQPVQPTLDDTHQRNQQDNSGRNRGDDHQPTQTPVVPTQPVQPTQDNRNRDQHQQTQTPVQQYPTRPAVQTPVVPAQPVQQQQKVVPSKWNRQPGQSTQQPTNPSHGINKRS